MRIYATFKAQIINTAQIDRDSYCSRTRGSPRQKAHRDDPDAAEVDA